MRRRDILKSLGGLGLGVGAVTGASLFRERQAHALFGQTPSGDEATRLPEEMRAKNVLELFLFGGLSQYESLYCVEEFGASDNTQWHAFLASGDIEKVLADCQVQGSPALLQTFGKDSKGMDVKLGPFALPLRARPDLLARTRIAVTAHEFEPHEVAVPLALSGRPLGNPSMAGLGSHVQRYFRETVGIGLDTPLSYVLLNSAPTLSDFTRGALATGSHPSSVRPLGIKIDASSDFVNQLSRATVGDHHKAYDALVQGNINRYQKRLRWGGKGDPLRSISALDLATASNVMASAESIQKVLDPSLFKELPGSSCGLNVALDPTTMNLRLAAHLLTQDTTPARYVCVIDGGISPAADAGGYDTHELNCPGQMRNLTNTFQALSSIINQPGEKDPTKLNLDETMIIINTEFGRTPQVTGNKGRGHWPYGYPVYYIGGPIREQNAGIHGAIGADARAIESVTPTENRIAALIAMGIWPFSQDSYNVSDVTVAGSEPASVMNIKKRILGIG